MNIIKKKIITIVLSCSFLLITLSSIGQSNLPRLVSIDGKTYVISSLEQFKYFHYIDVERKSCIKRDSILLERVKIQEEMLCIDSIKISNLESIIFFEEEKNRECNNYNSLLLNKNTDLEKQNKQLKNWLKIVGTISLTQLGLILIMIYGQ